MKTKSLSPKALVLALAAFCFMGSAGAIPLLCEDASARNVPFDKLSSCPDAGVSVDASHWQTNREIVLGFQQSGGEKLNTWFVYYFNPLLHSGDWRFVKILDSEGRLAHIKLYTDATAKNVPEPGTLALLGLGLLGAGIARRRKRV